MWKRLKTHFGSGLLVLSPLFLTVLIILYLLRIADRFVVNPLFQVLPIDVEVSFKIFLTKLLIAFVVTLFICGIGMLAERFLTRRFLKMFESFFANLPVFNRLYLPIKDIAQAFFGDKSGVFKRAVYLEYPRKGVWSLGFVTQEKRWDIHEKTGREIVNVFVPSPPNPATGFFIFVPKEELIDAGITIEEAIKMVFSGGAAVPALKQ